VQRIIKENPEVRGKSYHLSGWIRELREDSSLIYMLEESKVEFYSHSPQLIELEAKNPLSKVEKSIVSSHHPNGLEPSTSHQLQARVSTFHANIPRGTSTTQLKA
jgi:hypothetical protein